MSDLFFFERIVPTYVGREIFSLPILVSGPQGLRRHFLSTVVSSGEGAT